MRETEEWQDERDDGDFAAADLLFAGGGEDGPAAFAALSDDDDAGSSPAAGAAWSAEGDFDAEDLVEHVAAERAAVEVGERDHGDHDGHDHHDDYGDHDDGDEHGGDHDQGDDHHDDHHDDDDGDQGDDGHRAEGDGAETEQSPPRSTWAQHHTRKQTILAFLLMTNLLLMGVMIAMPQGIIEEGGEPHAAAPDLHPGRADERQAADEAAGVSHPVAPAPRPGGRAAAPPPPVPTPDPPYAEALPEVLVGSGTEGRSEPGPKLRLEPEPEPEPEPELRPEPEPELRPQPEPGPKPQAGPEPRQAEPRRAESRPTPLARPAREAEPRPTPQFLVDLYQQGHAALTRAGSLPAGAKRDALLLQARNSLARCLGLGLEDPHRGPALVVFGRTCLERGHFLAARAAAIEAQRRSHGMDGNWLEQARLLDARTAVALGAPAPVVLARLERLVRSAPADMPELTHLLADTFLERGEFDRAIACADLLVGEGGARGDGARVIKIEAMLRQALRDGRLADFAARALATARGIGGAAEQARAAAWIAHGYECLGDTARAADAYRGMLR